MSSDFTRSSKLAVFLELSFLRRIASSKYREQLHSFSIGMLCRHRLMHQQMHSLG